MGKSPAIVQCNHTPLKGYFDLINMVDEFILLDDVQHNRRDWRNRNKVKIANGPMWLTIPIQAKGEYLEKINETLISDPEWGKRHWQTIVPNHSGARHFLDYRQAFEESYLGSTTPYLSHFNHRFLTMICSALGIRTRLSWSTDYEHVEGKMERLVSPCRQLVLGDTCPARPPRGTWTKTCCEERVSPFATWATRAIPSMNSSSRRSSIRSASST